MTARGTLLPKGECPVCGGHWAVVGKGADDVIRKHGAAKVEQMDGKGKCLGSGNPPVRIFPNPPHKVD